MDYSTAYNIAVTIDRIKDLDKRMTKNRRNYKKYPDERFLTTNEEMKAEKQMWIKQLKDKYNFIYGKDQVEWGIDLGEFVDI